VQSPLVPFPFNSDGITIAGEVLLAKKRSRRFEGLQQENLFFIT
jgi:hypothetical protein